jgi:hypothetical protein
MSFSTQAQTHDIKYPSERLRTAPKELQAVILSFCIVRCAGGDTCRLGVNC